MKIDNRWLGLVMIIAVLGIMLMMFPYMRVYNSATAVENRCNAKWQEMVNTNPIAYEQWKFNSEFGRIDETFGAGTNVTQTKTIYSSDGEIISKEVNQYASQDSCKNC